MGSNDIKGNYDLQTFSASEKVAQAAALAWLEELRLARTQGRGYCVALDGGRIARVFFKQTIDVFRAYTKLTNGWTGLFNSVHFFWGDERCVPPADPESNFGMACDLLLKPLGIADDRIHRVKGELEPAVAASEAEQELRRVAQHQKTTEPATPESQPVLDMIFLGMGEEGHTASLFPGEPEEVIASPAVYRPVVASKPPPHRITLGYATIAAARQVWLLASGTGKEQALRESLQPEGRTPLARVLRMRRETRIFTDLRLDSPASAS
jgi:6-phosphogluconolactonase